MPVPPVLPVPVIVTKQAEDKQAQGECGGRAVRPRRWERKAAQPLWKVARWFLKGMKELPCGPATLLLLGVRAEQVDLGEGETAALRVRGSSAESHKDMESTPCPPWTGG